MQILMLIIGLVVGAGAGIGVTTTILRNRLLAKSQQVLKDAEEKGEIIKKDKILQAKEKYLQMKGEYEKQVNERNGKIQQAEQKLRLNFLTNVKLRQKRSTSKALRNSNTSPVLLLKRLNSSLLIA